MRYLSLIALWPIAHGYIPPDIYCDCELIIMKGWFGWSYFWFCF